MISLIKNPFQDCAEADCGLDFDLAEDTSDNLIAHRFSLVKQFSRMRALKYLKVSVALIFVFAIVSGFSAFIGNAEMASIGLLLSLLMGLLSATFMHSASQSHLSQLAAQMFFQHYPAKGLTHIHGYRLIRKLGMTSSEQKKGPLIFLGDDLYQDSGLSTSVFYLGIHEKTEETVVIAYTQFVGHDRYISSQQSLDAFVASAFFGKKPNWVSLGAENSDSEVIPCVNDVIRNAFCGHQQVVLHPTVLPYLRKDSVFLRMALRNNSDLLDQLPEANHEHLWVWADVNLPFRMKKPLLGKGRLLSSLACSLPRLVAYRDEVPALLVRELTRYCVHREGGVHRRALALWLWNLSPTGGLEPEDPASNNGWMLKCTILLTSENTSIKLVSRSEQLKDVLLDAYRAMILASGLDPNAQGDEACHLGYKTLFGLEATLAAIPGSGRTLLNNDLGL